MRHSCDLWGSFAPHELALAERMVLSEMASQVYFTTELRSDDLRSQIRKRIHSHSRIFTPFAGKESPSSAGAT
jgi:hypothetical protein